MSETCRGCRFWGWGDEDEPGNLAPCRRYAPRDSTGEWPRTFHARWCGEWEAKAAPPDALDTIDPTALSQARNNALEEAANRIEAGVVGVVSDDERAVTIVNKTAALFAASIRSMKAKE